MTCGFLQELVFFVAEVVVFVFSISFMVVGVVWFVMVSVVVWDLTAVAVFFGVLVRVVLAFAGAAFDGSCGIDAAFWSATTAWVVFVAIAHMSPCDLALA
jgi:hypothetical protein